MSYADQLKDPKWQRKRLEIMDRDEWMCKQCGDIDTTLTVHHKSYRFKDGKFADVWDYDEKDLVTLCSNCHENETNDLELAKKNIYFLLRDRLSNADAFDNLFSVVDWLFNELGRRIGSDDINRVRKAIKNEVYLWKKGQHDA